MEIVEVAYFCLSIMLQGFSMKRWPLVSFQTDFGCHQDNVHLNCSLDMQ